MSLLWTTAKVSTDVTWLKASIQAGQISWEEEQTCYLYATTLVCPWNYCSFITSFTSTAPKPNTATQSNWSIMSSICYKTWTSFSSWKRMLKVKHRVWREHLIYILSLSKWHCKRQKLFLDEASSCNKGWEKISSSIHLRVHNIMELVSSQKD